MPLFVHLQESQDSIIESSAIIQKLFASRSPFQVSDSKLGRAIIITSTLVVSLLFTLLVTIMSTTMALNIVRSTSLKTQKSPPHSPRRKKIVRFADSLGLDLEAVKMIMQEDLPSIPDSAFVHLDIPEEWVPHDLLKSAATKSLAFTPVSCAISTTTNGYKPFLNGYHVMTGSPSASPTRNGWSSPNRNGRSNSPSDFNGRGSPSVEDLNVACAAVSLSSSPVVQSKFLHYDMLNDSINMMNGSENNGRRGMIRTGLTNGVGINGSNSSLNRMEEPMSSVNKAMPPWLQLYQQTTRSTLIPEFVEPFIQMNFLDRVRTQNVCLENCYISTSSVSGSISVTCCVRLVNRGFEKQVYVRYTTNEWTTFTDISASYIPRSSDGWSDRFTATFSVKNLSAGQKVYVAIKYLANGSEEYWDNNNGNNYSFMHRI